MRKLDAAISVAADYAYHLYSADKVGKDQAISAGVSAVLKAAKSSDAQMVLRQRPQQYIVPPGIGDLGQIAATTIMGIGSLISVIGWAKKLFTGG